MKKIFKAIIRYLLAGPSMELAGRWPSRLHIAGMRRLNNIQLGAKQLRAISAAVKRKAPCKMLIFGLGNDSAFWLKLNRGGVTVFVEDDRNWFKKITRRWKPLKAFLVDYHTHTGDWRRLLEDPSLLRMTMPEDVEKEAWDVILVDGPAGWNHQSPGRMKSICLSARLVRHPGDIFVHDCNRVIEDVYCNTFLKKENLAAEEEGPNGLLRHYHMSDRLG